jgi:GNAT superfamily N-acetyltransferase
MNPFTIYPATELDVPPLLSMIRELAEFELLARELEITAESLQRALFSTRPTAAALLARAGDEPAGYAVYYPTFSTFAGRPGIFLDNLYVRPPFRQCGIGHALLHQVAKVGEQFDGGRFEQITLRWNVNAFRFYHSIGAEVMENGVLLRMNGPQACKWMHTAAMKGRWGENNFFQSNIHSGKRSRRPTTTL